MRKASYQIATALALSLFLPATAQSDDPIPIMRGIYAARYALVSVFEVQPGRESEFQNVMLQAGPYNRRLQGFANERVLEMSTAPLSEGVLSARTMGRRVVSLTRSYDAETAQFVGQQRAPAVRNLLQSEPAYITVSLVEHLFSNWSWEKPGTAFTVVATPVSVVSPATGQSLTLLQQSTNLFRQSDVSLGFLKDGYVGQIGMLDSFPSGTDLQNVRNQLQQRVGLMGASIYQAQDSSYYVYSEYFQAPAAERARTITARPERVEGAQLGSVVQNYVSR